MNLSETESIKHIQNKLDLKRMFEIEKRAVIAETELEAVYIKQVTGKQDTAKIRSIIESFNELNEFYLKKVPPGQDIEKGFYNFDWRNYNIFVIIQRSYNVIICPVNNTVGSAIKASSVMEI